MTSSPGWISSSSAAISSACVQEVVSSTLGTPRACFEEGLALLREGPVAGDVAVGDGLGDVDLFLPLETRPVEGDVQPGRRRPGGMRAV